MAAAATRNDAHRWWFVLQCEARVGDVAAALVAARALVLARDGFGQTALHWAAMSGRGDCCRLLLDAGADVRVLSFDGQTPLHAAAIARSVECTGQLLAAGADVNALDSYGYSALDAAVLRGECVVAALLRDAAAASSRWSGLRRAALAAWCAPCVVG